VSLKDASVYNIQFVEGKPVLIDTLSFEEYKENKPWVAYNQFCKHFLAPLALMAYKDAGLMKLMSVYLDGIPLEIADSILSLKNKIHFGIFVHIVLHAKAQKKCTAEDRERSNRELKGKMGLNSHKGLMVSLLNTVMNIKIPPKATRWNGYYEDNHSEEYYADKREIISKFLDIAKPKNVWDFGANTGMFSRIASEKGIQVISSDYDPGCVEKNYQTMKTKGEKNILPLIMDLTNPSPAIGWELKERESFFERGPVDLILALALVHHLAIANNVPLSMIAEFFAGICSHLIVEFIPKTDKMVKILLQNREDIFNKYDIDQFEIEFQKYFIIKEKHLLKNSQRTVYLMIKKGL